MVNTPLQRNSANHAELPVDEEIRLEAFCDLVANIVNRVLTGYEAARDNYHIPDSLEVNR